MKGQQERAQRRLEFANQVSRLQNQLAYEKQRDTAGEWLIGAVRLKLLFASTLIYMYMFNSSIIHLYMYMSYMYAVWNTTNYQKYSVHD